MEVSTSGLLPDARVNNAQSQDAETGGEREEDKTEVSVDRNEKTEISDMVSVELELSSKHVSPVEHQDNATEARQRGQHSDQLNYQDAHTKKLSNHKHNMPGDDGGCKQGGSDMLYEVHTQQREEMKDVKRDNEQSKAGTLIPSLSKGFWDYSEQKISVSHTTHTEPTKEQENKVDEHIQNREDLERRKELTASVEKMSLMNPQSQESAEMKEAVVEDRGRRRINGKIIEEEFKGTSNGLRRCSGTKTIAAIIVKKSKVSIRSQAGDGGSTDCLKLNDSPRPEQQTQSDTTVNTTQENSFTSRCSTKETQEVSYEQIQVAGTKHAMKSRCTHERRRSRRYAPYCKNTKLK